MSQSLQSLGERERVHSNPRTLCATPEKTQTGEEKKADELGTSGHEGDTQRFPQVPFGSGHPGLGAGEAISLDKPTGTHKNSLLSPAGKGQPAKAGNSDEDHKHRRGCYGPTRPARAEGDRDPHPARLEQVPAPPPGGQVGWPEEAYWRVMISH